MTTVLQIIIDAYRQSNLTPINTELSTPQETEGLRYLQRIVKSVFGNEAGEQLEPFPIGRLGIDRPSGWPWYDNVPPADWFVPKNTRLMCNLTNASTVYLHPVPDDGSRLGVIDVASDFATTPLTIDPNGRRIEGATSLVLSTNGIDTEWFYRGDLGNWMKTSTLTYFDIFPFPEEFDDMFITMLAMRLNPSYDRSADDQSIVVLNRSRSQFRARYSQHIQAPSEEALLRMPKQAVDRDTYSNGWYWGNTESMFKRGYPF